jgi:hypothetical protein
MVLSLADAVAIFNKWKEDSAEILVVIESPFQQSRAPSLSKGLTGLWGCKARCRRPKSIPPKRERRLAQLSCKRRPKSLAEYWSLHFCVREPREAKPLVRAEAEDTTVPALSVFFPSDGVLIFYELREPLGKTSLLA